MNIRYTDSNQIGKKKLGDIIDYLGKDYIIIQSDYNVMGDNYIYTIEELVYQDIK